MKLQVEVRRLHDAEGLHISLWPDLRTPMAGARRLPTLKVTRPHAARCRLRWSRNQAHRLPLRISMGLFPLNTAHGLGNKHRRIPPRKGTAYGSGYYPTLRRCMQALTPTRCHVQPRLSHCSHGSPIANCPAYKSLCYLCCTLAPT